LVNVIERCATLAEPHAKIVDVDLLPEEFQGAAHPLSVPSAEGDQTLLQAVEDLERVLVAEALKKFGGNRTKAAESLGLSRRGLLNKIERYGLSENV
jgi:transcriptional regulator with PAS, ATPase and Fis domain